MNELFSTYIIDICISSILLLLPNKQNIALKNLINFLKKLVDLKINIRSTYVHKSWGNFLQSRKGLRTVFFQKNSKIMRWAIGVFCKCLHGNRDSGRAVLITYSETFLD